MTDLHVQIRRLPKPVVAMVAGYAIGGGHVLHVVCDLTIAADNARFGQTGPQGRLASTAASAPALLADLVGPKKAKEIWFLCRQYDAQQALEMGLVNTVVPLERLEEETVAWCREMLALSPFALRLLKASFNAAEDGLAGHPAARPRRQPPLLRERRGAGGPRRLPGEAQARLLAVPAPAREPWRRSARVRIWLMAARAAHAAGGDRAGARRHRARRRPRRVPPAGASSPRCSARSSSRSARTSPTTTPTRAAAPTPRTASARCASPPAGSSRRGQVLRRDLRDVRRSRSLCGVYLVAVAGWELLAVGAASILAGVLYTGGPRPYGYEGLGEVFVFLFFGIVAVAGSYFVQVEHAAVGGVRAARCPVGLLAAAILVVNNVRDIDDRPPRRQAHARRAARPRAHARRLRRDGLRCAFVTAPRAVARSGSIDAVAAAAAGCRCRSPSALVRRRAHAAPTARRSTARSRAPGMLQLVLLRPALGRDPAAELSAP